MPVCQVIWSKVLPKNSQGKQLDQSNQITTCKFDKDISSEILLYPELSIGEKIYSDPEPQHIYPYTWKQVISYEALLTNCCKLN